MNDYVFLIIIGILFIMLLVRDKGHSRESNVLHFTLLLIELFDALFVV